MPVRARARRMGWFGLEANRSPPAENTRPTHHCGETAKTGDHTEAQRGNTKQTQLLTSQLQSKSYSWFYAPRARLAKGGTGIESRREAHVEHRTEMK